MINLTLLTVHGFWSSPATWDRLSAVWQADEQMDGLKIHPFGYPSPNKPHLPFSPTRVPDYDDIAQTLATEYTVALAEAENIAVVTHSQGGLILQRFLAWMVGEGRGQELARIRSVVMLACPNGGSEYLRSIRQVLGYGRHAQAGNLEVINRRVTDTQRTVLQRIVNGTSVDDHQCRIPFHVYAGNSDRIVPAASAQAGFPRASALAGNHFSILDPGFPGNRTAEAVKLHLITDVPEGSAKYSGHLPLSSENRRPIAAPWTGAAETPVTGLISETTTSTLLGQPSDSPRHAGSVPTASTAKTHSTNARPGKRPVVLGVVTAAVVTATLLSFLLDNALQSSPATHPKTVVKHPPAVSVEPASHVTATIPVGNGPYGVAVDAATHTAYVTNSNGGSVSVINTATNTVTTTIGVGKGPYGVAVDPATHTAYVTNGFSNSVSVINTVNNTVTATIHVGNGPTAIAVDPATHTAYITNFESASVSVINTATNTVSVTIDVGEGPFAVALDPAASTAYIANAGGTSVSVINTVSNTLSRTVTIAATTTADEQLPSGVALDPAGHTAYIANWTDGSVAVINTASNIVIATIPVGKHPDGVAVDPTTHTAYVTNDYVGSLSVINTASNTVTATIHVGNGPNGVTVNPAGRTAYVTIINGASVLVISTGR